MDSTGPQIRSSDGFEQPNEKELYQRLLNPEISSREEVREDLRSTPLMTFAVRDAVDCEVGGRRRDSGLGNPETVFGQFAVLGFHAGKHHAICENEPILMNLNAPISAFICGSQGSGKSFTLGSMMENSLIADRRLGHMTTPAAGLALHYDPDPAGAMAEAAYICSMGVRVRVLVPRSIEHASEAAYRTLPGAREYLKVKPLVFRPSDLSVERMLRFMAFADNGSAIPPYMPVVQRILRHMAINAEGGAFDYVAFRKAIWAEKLSLEQMAPLHLRISLLESFLDVTQEKDERSTRAPLDLEPGALTIIDLADPFVDAATACILFDTCLSLVEERQSPRPLVVAMDDAHNYMTGSLAASNLTDRLSGIIRQQRHNAIQVFIATRKPKAAGALLHQCNVSIIHRFTSAARSVPSQGELGATLGPAAPSPWHDEIVERTPEFKVGESLVFAPSAFLCLSEAGEAGELGWTSITMKTRARLESDEAMTIPESTLTGPPIERRKVTRRAALARRVPQLKRQDVSYDPMSFLQTIPQTSSDIGSPHHTPDRDT